MILTLSMLIFHAFVVPAYFFFKINFLKIKSFRYTIRVSKGFDPDRD